MDGGTVIVGEGGGGVRCGFSSSLEWGLVETASSPNYVLDYYHLSCRTVSRDFRPLLFCSKDSTWAPYEPAKTVSRTFSFSRRFSIFDVHIVNDYDDTYPRSNDFVTVFAFSFGAKVDFLDKKNIENL